MLLATAMHSVIDTTFNIVVLDVPTMKYRVFHDVIVPKFRKVTTREDIFFLKHNQFW